VICERRNTTVSKLKDSVAYPVVILSHVETINLYVTGEGDSSLFVCLFIYLFIYLFIATLVSSSGA